MLDNREHKTVPRNCRLNAHKANTKEHLRKPDFKTVIHMSTVMLWHEQMYTARTDLISVAKVLVNTNLRG